MGSSGIISFVPQTEEDSEQLWGVAKKSRPDEGHCHIKKLYAELKLLSSEKRVNHGDGSSPTSRYLIISPSSCLIPISLSTQALFSSRRRPPNEAKDEPVQHKQAFAVLVRKTTVVDRGMTPPSAMTAPNKHKASMFPQCGVMVRP